MAVFAIPNPKKNLSVDFPIEKVRQGVKNLSLINQKYRFSNSNEIFNQYTYESYEFLSLGVYIDINLNSVTENKTEITVEIRRKLGTFNESHEVTHANNHIINIVNYIAQLVSMSSDDIIKLKSSQTQNVKVKTQGLKDKNIATILALFLGGLGIHRFYLGQPLIGILYLIFCWTFIPLCLSIIDFFAFIFMSQNRFNSKYNI
ncbi:TM2 domain-containing protein [Chryseobacterium indoltheticum]|uniref:TM2 domain n=1 Tax=Chryseobacterium indoltheticum TaxID=254 RepID=A0A381F5W9_9FLAO|nr:TM2 domain-containing protein [Chryseobacterium indoltheticum]SIQ86790.1 TM2 domain-containing membrane protein YozV [Chryseobacterium indoltheticum]SUX41989.1 TM2 domain [Chryseobacterium indoltheticum]